MQVQMIILSHINIKTPIECVDLKAKVKAEIPDEITVL
jgi:hypothetical protein